MTKNDKEKLSMELGDRLLYPSFNVVPLVSRAVLNFHSLLGNGPEQLLEHYDALEKVGSPVFNRRRFGDPDAALELLKHDHYLFSNLRESVESETHRKEFEQLLASMTTCQDDLGIGPKDWLDYACALEQIEQVRGETFASPSAMEDVERSVMMERLGWFLSWPVTGGVLPLVEDQLNSAGASFCGGGWLFRLASPLEEANEALPDILLSGCSLEAGKIGGECRLHQVAPVHWPESDRLPVEPPVVEKILNLLTVSLGLPEALEGDRAMFLAIPLFERCEATGSGSQHLFGHLLGWLIYPLIAKQSGEDLLQQIHDKIEPMSAFVASCFSAGNVLSADLLGAITRETINNANPEREPIEELERLLPGSLGWRVKVVVDETTDDCYFDRDANRLVLQLQTDGVARKHLELTPWENSPATREPLFRPPSEREHAYVHTVAQRVRTIHSLLNDKYQSVLLEREKELAKLYFKDLAQLLSRTFLDMMSWLKSDAWEQDAAAQKQRFEERLNRDCARTLAEDYAGSGLPRMVFRFGDGAGGQCLLDCCPDHQEMPIRDESREVAEAWSLLGSLHYDMKERSSEAQSRLQALFCQEVKYLVRFDLPHVVEAVRKTAREGGMYFGRAVKHELSRMIRKMGPCIHSLDREGELDRLRWLHRILAHRLHTLGKEGKSRFGEEVLGKFDARQQMEFIKWMIDYSEELEGLKGRRWFKSKIIFLPSVVDDWEITMSVAAFEAVFTNLWNNAHDILVVACVSEIPEGKLKERVRKTVEKVGFYNQRFPGWRGPSPRRIGMLWKKDGWFFVGVLDNAPQLLTVPPDYPSRFPEGHLGMQVIQDVAQAMCEQGIEAVYEPAHLLEDDPRAQWVADQMNKLGDTDFTVESLADWTLACLRFSLSK